MTTRQNQYHIIAGANRADCRRQVVNQRNNKLKAFSAKGVRTDIVIAVFTVFFILLFALLFTDLSSLNHAGSNIRQTSSRIESLKAQNEQVRMDIALAEQHPVLAADPYDQAFLIRMTVPDGERQPVSDVFPTSLEK